MFLTRDQIDQVGFRWVGENVQISDKAVFYNPGNIYIDDNTRIDDFCILSAGAGGIILGKYVHIACYVSMIGKASIVIEDYVGISARTSIYSSNDDYSGNYMTNPCIPSEYTNVSSYPVFIRKHSILGAGCIVLPGVEIESNCAFGSMSFIRSNTYERDTIYAGNPVRKIGERSTKLYQLEEQWKQSQK